MSKNITYTNKDNFRINRYAYIMQLEHYKDLIEYAKTIKDEKRKNKKEVGNF